MENKKEFIDKYALDFNNEIIDEEEKNNVLKYVEIIQLIVFEALTYLKHKKLIRLPNNIKIERYYGDVIIKNLYNDNIISEIHIRIRNRYKYLRIFKVYTLNNKNRLTENLVAYYISNYDKLDCMPPHPTELQEKILLSTYKKITDIVTPLNIKALEIEKEESEYNSSKKLKKHKKKTNTKTY